jgi:glycogen synthase
MRCAEARTLLLANVRLVLINSMTRSGISTRAHSSPRRTGHSLYAQPVRVVHVSWEYPPIIYGGLGRHVHALAEAQAARGDEVLVLTQGSTQSREWINGVEILRIPRDPPAMALSDDTLVEWVLSMQTAMIREGIAIGHADVIHAHDWVSAHASIALRHILPADALVATIHATEAGRHQGWLPGATSDAIHAIEHWLVHCSDRVVVCSQHMRNEVQTLFSAGAERIEVIPNGIDLSRWRTTRPRMLRVRDAHAATGPLVVFVGRLEWEKGAHTLIDALPRLRRGAPGLRAVIAGRGSHADSLQQLARERRVAGSVDFVGWLPEPDLHSLIAAADALVIPSLYEPFGLVALEGAALGAPLVVARTGGLQEFVADGVTGRTFEAGSSTSLADAVLKTLDDPVASRAMAQDARERLLLDHGWGSLAEQTAAVYEHARSNRRRRDADIAPVTIPDRSVNLLARDA